VIELRAPANTIVPAITGIAQDGLVLTRISRGTWSDAGALTYADQWERCSSAGTACTPIAGATGTVYRASSADVGHQITLAVTASNQYGLTATATTAPTAVVADPVAPVNTTAPAFSGSAQKGQVLTMTGRGCGPAPTRCPTAISGSAATTRAQTAWRSRARPAPCTA